MRQQENPALSDRGVKRRRRAAAWTRRVRHSFYLRNWRETGSLYAGLTHYTGSGDIAAWQAPAQLERVSDAGYDIGDSFARNNSGTEGELFLFEHLLSLGVLGLHRNAATGHIESRFARPKSCRRCYGMTWRVDGWRCNGCGLERRECA